MTRIWLWGQVDPVATAAGVDGPGTVAFLWHPMQCMGSDSDVGRRRKARDRSGPKQAQNATVRNPPWARSVPPVQAMEETEGESIASDVSGDRGAVEKVVCVAPAFQSKASAAAAAKTYFRLTIVLASSVQQEIQQKRESRLRRGNSSPEARTVSAETAKRTALAIDGILDLSNKPQVRKQGRSSSEKRAPIWEVSKSIFIPSEAVGRRQQCFSGINSFV